MPALIDAAALAAARQQRAEATVIVDCRYALGQPAAGWLAYLEAHIPGAYYADLAHDLSGPPATDHGRHPLPAPAGLAEVFGRLGIAADSAVVAYDDAGGMVAARLWWMLRYLGHRAVAVLDGGWQAWVAAGGACASGDERATPRHYPLPPTARRDRLVTLDAVVAQSLQPSQPLLVDARDGARYRGEVEPIDPRAGHIPGARNHPWSQNLGADGRFVAPDELRARFHANLGRLPDADTVYYCGSGVSACHDVLAQVVAGLPEPRLYVGSWSEWSRDGGRAVAIGGESAT